MHEILILINDFAHFKIPTDEVPIIQLIVWNREFRKQNKYLMGKDVTIKTLTGLFWVRIFGSGEGL